MNELTMPALEIRVLSVEDRMEIQDLISEFNRHEDTGNAEAWAALFTEDGSMVGLGKQPVTGRENLVALARRRWAEQPETHNRAHWVCNIVIHATPEGASAESYQMSVDKKDGGLKIVAVNLKSDDLRTESGHWRFLSRRVVPLGGR